PPSRYTYKETDSIIDGLALSLTLRGFGRGTAAVVLLKNRIEFLLIAPALGRIGVSTIPASWRSTVPEIEYLAKHSGATAIFFDADIADVIREAMPKLPNVPQKNLFVVGGSAAGFPSWEELLTKEQGEVPDA